jgi:hypothetical protein
LLASWFGKKVFKSHFFSWLILWELLTFWIRDKSLLVLYCVNLNIESVDLRFGSIVLYLWKHESTLWWLSNILKLGLWDCLSFFLRDWTTPFRYMRVYILNNLIGFCLNRNVVSVFHCRCIHSYFILTPYMFLSSRFHSELVSF